MESKKNNKQKGVMSEDVQQEKEMFNKKVKAQKDQSQYGAPKSQPVVEFSSKDVNSWTNMQKAIGQGSSCKIYKGLYKEEDVAVKVYNDENIEKLTMKSMWQAEKEALMELKHPSIVKLIGYVNDDQLMLILQYLPTSLSEKHTELTWEQMMHIFIDIAKTVSYIHQQSYVLVDLKTDNLMLDEAGKVKFIDFGGITQIGKTIKNFSSGYNDPTVQNGGKATIEADVYSMGIIMLQLLMRSSSVGYKKATASPNKGRGKLDKDEDVLIHERAKMLWDAKKCVARVMPDGCSEEKGMAISELALSCVGPSRDRPTANEIVSKLEEINRKPK